MENKNLLWLAFANILWGFIPLPANHLFTIYSTFAIIFSRFLFTGMILGAFSLYLIIKNKISIKILGIYLKEPNNRFFKLPQWLYLLILSTFGLNNSILFFFWGLRTVGTIITAMGFIIALIIITTINWGLKKEEFSRFKFLYLVILLITLTILARVSRLSDDTSVNFSLETLILVLGYGATLSIFVIVSETDKMGKFELNLAKEKSSYNLLRSMLKITFLSIFAGITLIPTIAIAQRFTLDADFKQESVLFFEQIQSKNWIQLATSANGIILILLFTIAPYSIFYYLAQNWNAKDSFDLWAGVLQILEPLINIVIGITLLDERFPLEWLIIILILLGISIITKYLSETEASIHAIMLIKLKEFDIGKCQQKKAQTKIAKNTVKLPIFASHKQVVDFLYNIKSIRSIHTLIGEFDLMCNIYAPTQKYLTQLIQEKINLIERIDNYQLLVITQEN